MRETFTQYLKRWLSHSTERGLNNPLVKMPVKRFRKLQEFEFSELARGGSRPIGTTSDPIARNLLKNFKTRINERGEHCAYLCFGSVEMKIAAAAGQEEKTTLFPVCLKKASLSAGGQNVRASVSDDEGWLFNPVLKTHLRNFGIPVPETLADNPDPLELTNWVKSQLTNRAKIELVGYVGLFSSQQMVIQERFEDPRLCHVLAKNPVMRAKLDGEQTDVPPDAETTDAGLEDLGMVLPCDDSQLRVVQLSDQRCSLQVEGPPGTGKSQTIANIISNALWRGRSVLLVCDKKAAITQVEERLSDAGLKPALLNLHDEGSDNEKKKQFLRQATERFSSSGSQVQYPFSQLSQTREVLNERVRFGRKVCHAAMQVCNAEALGGLIQLKRELAGNVPPLDIANWQAISSERLTPLLQAIGGWPGFAAIVTDSASLWNRLHTESFTNNPNVENELTNLSQKILAQLEALNELRELTASVGADSKLVSDTDAAAMLTLAEVVLRRPACHHEVVGNKEVSLPELSDLKRVWLKRDELVKACHPVPLDTPYPTEAEQEAKEILASEQCASWHEMSQHAQAHDSQRGELEAIQPAYRRLCDQLGLIYSPFLKFRRAQLEAVLRLGELRCSIPRSWWSSKSTPVLSVIEAQREFARCNERLKRLAHYQGINTPGHAFPDWEFMQASIAWRDLFEQLCGVQRLDIDRKLWGDIAVHLKAHQTSLAESYVRLNHYFENATSGLTDYDSLVSLVGEIQTELPRYQLWLEKKKWQEKIRGAYPELVALWGKLIEGTVKPENAKRLFCFNLLRLCNPIAKPDGTELRQTLDTFIAQDERLTEWTVNDLKRKLAARMQKAEAEHPSAYGRLRHLAGLQRLPAVRAMLNNSPNFDVLSLLLKSKPCWMMSPTSLANLVDLSIFDGGQAPFDLVIFDEASQIRVLDGLLSMSFGTQVIIVGDKKQLPPTDFFASFANPDGDEDSADSAISESLLDEFTGQLHDEMLMSHYRSETPDLIRFSNLKFYDERLELYPPAHVSGIGRRLHYVKNAVYSETAGQRNNRREAEEVVSLIGAHVRDFDDKSLGVVTMNIPQMELIEELLQSAPAPVQSFCADDAKFFLRNLETVQGDEMDRIIVSLTYGKKSADAPFNASTLGPLIKKGGERRLNVAVTRSRSGMIVVSSLTSADLAASGATSEGFHCFKAFLQDLETAASASNFGITNERFQKRNNGVSNLVFCDSPFEEQVVEFLENQGITEIECQYGCGKFRIDIVVKERGKNLLAIECDGAAYHSSLVARTRDRARQRILETRGWRGRIHRVWSTNWWHFEAQEKQAILAAISAARQAQQSATSRGQSANHPPQPSASTPAHDPQEDKEPEPADITVDDAGNVFEKGQLKPNEPDALPEEVPVTVSDAGQSASSPAFGPRPQRSSQPQLKLEVPKNGGEAGVTATDLRNALYHFIPDTGKIAREELLEKASTHLGLPLKKARSELNRMIADEKRAGRLDLDSGWENVWRA